MQHGGYIADRVGRHDAELLRPHARLEEAAHSARHRLRLRPVALARALALLPPLPHLVIIYDC